MLIRSLCALLFVLALVVPAAAPVRAEDGLSGAQKAEVERIIRAYLLEHPELMVEVMQRLEAKQKAAARDNSRELVGRYRTELFKSDEDFVLNAAGKVPMVEFFDYQCGYCKKIVNDVMRVTDDNPNVRIIFKEFPVLGDASVVAAKAALAARKQGKYLEFHNAMMGLRRGLSDQLIMATAADVGLDTDRLKTDMASAEVAETIDKNLMLAHLMNIRGTPTLIIGDNLVPGAISYQQMQSLIDEAAAGCQAC